MENYIGINKYELDTPALVIDKTKLIHNLSTMQQFALNHKIKLRPHAKTHKCSNIARLQLEHGAVGICVAKVSEAYELAKTGIGGILITSPLVTVAKINTLIQVLKLAPDTMLVVDNIDNAQYLNKLLGVAGLRLNVLMDIESGQLRTGVLLPQAMELAQAINKLANLNFMGIQCYAGHLQHIRDLAQRATLSQQILGQAAQIKRKLLSEGINCLIQSGSGTGTYAIDATLDGVTEIQPGSYTVMDKEYFDIQFENKQFLPAMTMLTTVISTNHTTHVTVDAGTKAMYVADTRPQVITPANLAYDWVFGDEHGQITALNNAQLPKLGTVIELLVAHCDPTINLFDHFYITQDDIVIERWDINLRGKSQ